MSLIARHSPGVSGPLAASGLTVLICFAAYAAPWTGGDEPSPRPTSGDLPVRPPMAALPAATSRQACLDDLRRGGVSYRELASADAPGIAWPVQLTGPVAGVEIRGSAPGAPTEYLDCRLATTLLAWAPRLREEGVVALTHYSIYRQDALVGDSTKPSGHAHGMAIDVGLVTLRDGRTLSVQNDWSERAHGADPCEPSARDSDRGRTLRELTCDAATRQLFQIVLTPHYDAAHSNHVHLELAPATAAYLH